MRDEAFDDDLIELWRGHRPVALERIDVVRRAARNEVPQGDELEAARFAAHKLAGSLGMFGLAACSALAQQLNTVVEASDLATAGARAEARRLADELAELVVAA